MATPDAIDAPATRAAARMAYDEAKHVERDAQRKVDACHAVIVDYLMRDAGLSPFMQKRIARAVALRAELDAAQARTRDALRAWSASVNAPPEARD